MFVVRTHCVFVCMCCQRQHSFVSQRVSRNACLAEPLEAINNIRSTRRLVVHRLYTEINSFASCENEKMFKAENIR